jgi:hypothetical protein
MRVLRVLICQPYLDFIELFGLKRQGGRVTLGEEAAAAEKALEDDEPDWLPTRPGSKRPRLALSSDDDD